MLGARIDRAAAAHPSFKKYAEERIDIFFNTSLHTNINIFVTAGIAAGLLCHSTNDVLKWGSVAAAVLVWFAAALLAGFQKQWAFIFFEAVYFCLPQVLIIPESNETMREMQYFVSEIIETVWADPMNCLVPEPGYPVSGYILLIFYILIFLAGVKLRSSAKHSDLYCRARLGQLEEKTYK